MATWQHGKSRHERGYGYAWRKLRARVMHRDNYLCQPCLAKDRLTPATECDHITPKAKGGTDWPSNLQAICKECHQAKSLAEAAEAQGRAVHVRRPIGADGWPLD